MSRPPRKRERDDDPSSTTSRADHYLLRAIIRGDRAAAERAFAQGASVNAADPATGLTPLHVAVGTNNLPLAAFLVDEKGASFSADASGRWPSVVAIECDVSDAMDEYVLEKEQAFLTDPWPPSPRAVTDETFGAEQEEDTQDAAQEQAGAHMRGRGRGRRRQ